MKFIKLFGIMLLTLSLAHAADNSIYIDQIGSSSTINIKQDGSGNKVFGVGDSEGTPANFTGSSQTVDIRQVGGSNILGIDMNTTVVSGVGVDLKYYITGSNSVASIDINGDGLGTAANNTIDIQQTGNLNDLIFDLLGTGNTINAAMTGGTLNDLTFDIDADSLTVDVAVSGGGSNTVTLELGSSSSDIDITTVGASNAVNSTQTGVGVFDLDITANSSSN